MARYTIGVTPWWFASASSRAQSQAASRPESGGSSVPSVARRIATSAVSVVVAIVHSPRTSSGFGYCPPLSQCG